MTKAWLSGFWQLGVVTLITGSAITSLSFANTSSKTSVLAQIQPDSTLGSESSVVNSVDANSDRIDGGAIRSTNLFHSFQEFNVGEGKAVNFANPQGIENILSRVTGNNISEIRGVLGVLGNANLFLLNPNGIIFGENASLNVNGSFVATTANALQFGTQGIFSATNPETPSLLTVNPSALLFNQINQNAAIANNSQASAGQDPGGNNVFGLRVPDGKSLLLVGGNVNMDGGWAIASGGHIELGGLTEAGSIGIQGDESKFSLSFPEGVQRGDISLTNSAIVGVIADGGGSIAAHARNLEVLAGSVFFAGIGEGLGNTDAQAGDITVDATEQIKLTGTGSLIFNSVQSQAVGNAGNITIKTGSLSVSDGAQIDSLTRGQGNAGNITIQAEDTVTFDGADSNGFPSAAFSDVQPGAVGDGGNINIIAGSLSLTNGAELNASVSAASDSLPGGNGKGGSVNINVDETLTIAGGNRPGIFASLGAGATGSGGDININAGNVVLRDDGQINSSTLGKGDSGNISVTVDNAISLNATSFIVNQVASNEAEGNAGKIDITTNSLSATNGSQINSLTSGQGNGGDITIRAIDKVSFDGLGLSDSSSGIFTGVYRGAVGRAGDINIITGSLSLTNGAALSASTDGQGNAGNIVLEVSDRISLIGNSTILNSVISSEAEGNAGNIYTTTGSLSVTNDSQINSFTRGQGNAGDINIQAADAVTFDIGLMSTGVDTEAVGNAGDVNITARSLSLTDGSQIDSSTSGKGNGGNVTIQAKDTVFFDGLDSNNILTGVIAGVDAGAIGDGGNISITAGSLSLINGGTLEVKVRGETDTLPGGQGSGGTIDLNIHDVLTISGSYSQISSSLRSGAVGRGGEIKIQAGKLFLKDGGQIDAFTEGKGDSGNISITARDTVSVDRSIIANLVLSSETEGNAGKINITTDSLSLTNGSQITSLTRGQGNAGDINIQANDAVTLDGFQLIDNGNSIAYTSLFSNVDPGAVGNGGDINITAGSLFINDGVTISANTESIGNAGNIDITLREILEANNGGISTNSMQSSGGKIKITARDIILRKDSNIRSNIFSGAGSGGDITLSADSIIAFDDSDIFAFAQDGQGGNITLNTPAYFGNSFTANSFNTNPDILDNNDRADINATGAVSGVVTIPDVSFLQNSLTELPENIIDTNALVANSCIARSSDRGGTFTITGAGGLSTRPGDAAVSPYPTGDVRGVESDSTSTRRPWKIGDPIVEPQAAYRLANGQIVLSRECER